VTTTTRSASAPLALSRLRVPAIRWQREIITSLRLEMLFALGVLGATTLTLAVLTGLLIDRYSTSEWNPYSLGALILADVLLFVGFGAHKLKGLVLDPLAAVVATTEAVANGDLTRKVPDGTTSEFQRLAESVNRMTSRLLEEQAHRAHLEKVASVGRLAAGVAHEIGNPLGAITGYAHLLRRAAGANLDLREQLDGIDREAARIDRIMRGMLEYARPRRRATHPLDLNASTRRVIELLQAQGVLRGIDLRMELSPQLPLVVGDVHEMDQVLVNLVLNAVDAVSSQGTVCIVTQAVPFEQLRSGSGYRSRDDAHQSAPESEPSARVRAWMASVGDPELVVKVRDPASHGATVSACSTPSSPPRSRGRERGSVWPSSRASSNRWAEPSGCETPARAALRSPFSFQWPCATRRSPHRCRSR
jgi:signal transduction histidine kinase